MIIQALDLPGKSFGLLHALRPDLRRIGISRQPGNSLSEQWLKGWQQAAATQGATMVPLPFVRTLPEIEPMLALAKREEVQALVGAGPVPILLGTGFDRITAWAIQNKVLTITTTTLLSAQHLVSFGPSRWELRRIAAGQIDRILRGAKPGDIPIEQPTRFELIINKALAKAMGLTIPQSVLVQATEVIE